MKERLISVLNTFKYKLLIIDEVGFNEISPLEAKLFFQLIDLRYTKRSTIFTSNITFDKWSNILGNCKCQLETEPPFQSETEPPF